MSSIKERQANKAASINLDDDLDASPVTTTRTEPRTAPGQLINIQGKYAMALEENKQLQEKLINASTRELLIAELVEVPGRRRYLTTEQFDELTENLRNNPLVTSITVRRLGSNSYEIISGHNRVHAFKVLGRDRIDAKIVESDEDQATLSALYANLFQPELPDFEKYMGFMEIEAKFPNVSREEIAKNAGISKQHTYRIMSFNGLPDESKAILKESPALLGATAAQELAKLAGAGRGAQVTIAIEKLRNREFDQKQAVEYAAKDQTARDDAKSKKSTKIEPIRIMSGRSLYCNILRADKILRIVFNSADEAAAVQKSVEDILTEFAKQKK